MFIHITGVRDDADYDVLAMVSNDIAHADDLARSLAYTLAARIVMTTHDDPECNPEGMGFMEYGEMVLEGMALVTLEQPHAGPLPSDTDGWDFVALEPARFTAFLAAAALNSLVQGPVPVTAH